MFTDSLKFEHVFIDMDGVLCDFITAAMEVHGKTYVPSEYPKNEWNVENYLGVTPEAFWSAIDGKPSFWRDLNPLPHRHELFRVASSVGTSVSILSSPHRDWQGKCYGQKMAWLHRHSIETPLILCKQKWLLATHDRLLIDDSDSNCEKWREAGGKAILFPQPWNSLHELAGMQMTYVGTQLAEAMKARPAPSEAAQDASLMLELTEAHLSYLDNADTFGNRIRQSMAAKEPAPSTAEQAARKVLEESLRHPTPAKEAPAPPLSDNPSDYF